MFGTSYQREDYPQKDSSALAEHTSYSKFSGWSFTTPLGTAVASEAAHSRAQHTSNDEQLIYASVTCVSVAGVNWRHTFLLDDWVIEHTG